MIADDIIIRKFLVDCSLPRGRLDSLEELRRLYDDLQAAGEKTNLTALSDADDFWLLHVADSLSVGRVLPELLTDGLTVADVGCGAGFPMFPLAWANSKLRITGMEPRKRKAAFIEHEIAVLGLNNCSVLARQAREAGRLDEHANRYDVVLLRAVGTAGKLLRDCRNLLTKGPGGKIVFYKTPEAIQQELPTARREAGKFSLTIAESDIFALPRDAGTRQFLIFRR